MRKIVVALLLLSLVAISAQTLRAQSRARRVGQTNTTPTQPTTSSLPPQPDRPPTLGGAATSNDSSAARSRSSSSAQGGGEEVGDDDVVRVNTTLVTIPVSVMDRNGLFVPDVQKSEFRVWEDGVEQNVAYFATVEKPFTVALVLDTSGSTRFRLEEIQDAAIAFVNQLRADDRVLIVAFDDRINVLAEPTSDRNALRNAIRRTHTGDGTRLYDAVDFVINQRFNHIDGRKAIVLFTDGVDTTSKHHTYEENVRDAEELDALIYPVQYDTYLDATAGGTQGGNFPTGGGGQMGLPGILGDIITIMGGGGRRGGGGRGGGRGGGGGPIIIGGGGGGGNNCIGCSRADYERADAYLHDMARVSGGHLYRAETTRNIAEAFSDIAEQLRRQYSLGYYPKQVAQAGQRRQIKVRVNRPNLVVQARDSYIFNPSGATGATAQDNQQQRSKPILQKKSPLIAKE